MCCFRWWAPPSLFSSPGLEPPSHSAEGRPRGLGARMWVGLSLRSLSDSLSQRVLRTGLLIEHFRRRTQSADWLILIIHGVIYRPQNEALGYSYRNGTARAQVCCVRLNYNISNWLVCYTKQGRERILCDACMNFFFVFKKTLFTYLSVTIYLAQTR